METRDKELLTKGLLPDEVLALTLYGEARGESVDGQVAVANVIINRLRVQPGRYKSVIDVCLQDRQFSCWNDADPNYPKLIELALQISAGRIPSERAFIQCQYIARGVLNRIFADSTKGSLNYMTTDLFHSEKKPSWANDPKTKPLEIGNHTFFTA